MQNESDNTDYDNVPYDFATEAARKAEYFRARSREIIDADNAMTANFPERYAKSANAEEKTDESEFDREMREAGERFRNRATAPDDGGAAESARAERANRIYVVEEDRAVWPKAAWAPSTRRSCARNVRYVVWDPMSRSSSTARLNPLDLIRVGTPHECRDADRIAELLLGLERIDLRSQNEAHFMLHGSRLLSATILHTMYSLTERTLAGVLAEMTTDLNDIDDLRTIILGTEHDRDGKMGWTDSHGRPTTRHPGIVQRFNSTRTTASGEASGLYTTMTRGLSMFADPLVAANTATTDFDFDELFEDLALEIRVGMRGSRLQPVYDCVLGVLQDRLDERLSYGPLRHAPFMVGTPMLSMR
jgi:hypothetical protein